QNKKVALARDFDIQIPEPEIKLFVVDVIHTLQKFRQSQKDIKDAFLEDKAETARQNKREFFDQERITVDHNPPAGPVYFRNPLSYRSICIVVREPLTLPVKKITKSHYRRTISCRL